jgi:hypothetical protein
LLSAVRQQSAFATATTTTAPAEDTLLKKTIVYFGEPKIESKDHKWKDAPVVGVAPTTTTTGLTAPS